MLAYLRAKDQSTNLTTGDFRGILAQQTGNKTIQMIGAKIDVRRQMKSSVKTSCFNHMEPIKVEALSSSFFKY